MFVIDEKPIKSFMERMAEKPRWHPLSEVLVFRNGPSNLIRYWTSSRKQGLWWVFADYEVVEKDGFFQAKQPRHYAAVESVERALGVIANFQESARHMHGSGFVGVEIYPDAYIDAHSGRMTWAEARFCINPVTGKTTYLVNEYERKVDDHGSLPPSVVTKTVANISLAREALEDWQLREKRNFDVPDTPYGRLPNPARVRGFFKAANG